MAYKYDWWAYVKGMIRRYPDSCTVREREAVEAAIEDTRRFVDASERLRFIDLEFWRQSHTFIGAALECHISERTASTWHRDFIYSVARHFGLME